MLWVRAAARKSSEVASAMALTVVAFQFGVWLVGRVEGREEKRVRGVVIGLVLLWPPVVVFVV